MVDTRSSEEAARARVEQAAAAPRGATLVQRAALWSSRGWARRGWALVYEVLVRGYGRWLAAGRGETTVYARGSLARRRPVAGLSDLDLVVVVPDAQARRDIDARHVDLERRVPWLAQAVFEQPRVYAAAEIPRVVGQTTLTYDGALYGPDAPLGIYRHLERPGLDGAFTGWRRLRGPEHRLPEPEPDAQSLRLRAWLEVLYRWRWIWRAVAGGLPPIRAQDVVAKAVLETERAAITIGAHSEHEAVSLARAILRAPYRLEPHAVARLLPGALALADLLAAAIARQIEDAGVTEVRLVGIPDEPPLPLADWRAVVRPRPPTDTLVPFPGDAADPAVLRAAQRLGGGGAYPALRHGRLLLLAPHGFVRSGMRALQCETTDPVSFALLEGRDTARFPNVRGWSIEDWAARAVREHAEWTGVRDAHTEGREANAARAALLAQSVERGEPALHLTAEAVRAAHA